MAERKQIATGSFLSKFYQQRDADIIKQAEENGFFFNPTEESLLAQCQAHNRHQKNLEDLQLIQLSDLHLRVLGDIRMCTSLSICLLANNFLTKIDALISCKQLVRLDVHSNQLASIPGGSFWKSLHKLQVLHLHDNPLAKLETLQILGSSPCLSILTLYDTPLSLKKNYRHHVVNTVWTLKALDMHVISDEEIIEDAVFAYARFAALSPAFRVNLCPKTPTDLTYSQELTVFHSLIARVNSVLARHSPVHIVQRYVRGYLTRKRLRILKKPELLKLEKTMTHLPSTPVFPSSPLCTPYTEEVVDYDVYMANWRQSSLNEPFHEQGKTIHEQMSSQEYSPFSVNLERLQSGVLTELKTNNTSTETALPCRGDIKVGSKKERGKKLRKQERNKKPKSQRIQDIKQFFGPVVQTVIPEMDDEEISPVNFRITGRRPPILTVDATTEMILSKKEAGELIREAEAEQRRKELLQPLVTVKRNHLTTAEQRLFDKTHGTMSLSRLMAVHRAYREREKAEAAAAKAEHSLLLREERLHAKDKIRRYYSEKRLKVLKSRDMEKSQILEQLEKQEVQKLSFLNRLHEQKVQSLELKKKLQADYAFVQEFNSQRSSISKTLQRYDQQAYMEDSKRTRRQEVTNIKKTDQGQKEAVTKFLEHQKMMKQNEIASTKAALQTQLENQAKERMTEVQNRVACLKAKQASSVDACALPKASIVGACALPKASSVDACALPKASSVDACALPKASIVGASARLHSNSAPSGVLWEAPYEESSMNLLYRQQHALDV